MKRRSLFPYLLYLFVSAIVFPYIRWYADNPDTFQYISIAKKYISGDWSHVLNGYWSLLLSWLLTIPILVIKNDILAFKILQFLIGFFVLFQWNNLLNIIPLNKSIKNILSIAIIPFLVDYAFLNLTPDLLFVGFLLMLINALVAGNILSDRKQAMRTGIIGGALYLTKAFAFPFFIAFTSAIFLIEKVRKNGIDRQWKNLPVLYGIFFLICICWIVTISFHYDRFTISESARFNMNREAAPLPGRSNELPILHGGLFAPMENAISAWESPGEYLKDESITLFNSPSEYFKIISRNIFSIYYFDFRNQVGALFILLLIVFIIKKGIKELFITKWILTLLIFILLFYGGYALILVHARYTWINNLLMIILSAHFIQEIFNTPAFRYIKIIALSVLFIVSLKRPVKEILFTADKDYPAFWLFQAVKHPLQTMWIFYRPDMRLEKAVEEIKKESLLKGNFASLKTMGMERDSYTGSLRIVNSVKGRYYGQLNDTINFQELKNTLLENNIDYLITWRNTDWGNEIPVYINFDAGLRIYKAR